MITTQRVYVVESDITNAQVQIFRIGRYYGHYHGHDAQTLIREEFSKRGLTTEVFNMFMSENNLWELKINNTHWNKDGDRFTINGDKFDTYLNDFYSFDKIKKEYQRQKNLKILLGI